MFFLAALPGYFTSTFVNGIKLETTSTRRAGLIQFTFPDDEAFVVVDLAHDLGRSFSGGGLIIDPDQGRIILNGTFLQVGPSNASLSEGMLTSSCRAMVQTTTQLSHVTISSLPTDRSRSLRSEHMLLPIRQHQPA